MLLSFITSFGVHLAFLATGASGYYSVNLWRHLANDSK